LESARTYLQLSIALLGLTVAFRERVFGNGNLPRVNTSTVLCWAALLLSIGCNALYQYAAVHFLDAQSDYPAKAFLPMWLVNNPGRAYGAMVVLFYLAAILFVVPAFSELRHHIKKGDT
jgi:hypothetical protein